MTTPNPAVEFREIIREEIQKQLAGVDQVSMGKVVDISGRGEFYLQLNGGGWVDNSVAQSRVSQFTGDIEMTARVVPAEITFGTAQTFTQIRQFDPLAPGQTEPAYCILMLIPVPAKTLQYIWFMGDHLSDTWNPHLISTAPLPFDSDDEFWVKVVHEIDDGTAGNGNSIITFYYSTDGVIWVQLGDPVVEPNQVDMTGGVFQDTTLGDFQVGRRVDGFLFRGRIYEAEFKNDGEVLANPIFSSEEGWQFLDGDGVTRTGSDGIPWRIRGTVRIQAQIIDIMVLLDGMSIPLPMSWTSIFPPRINDRVVANSLRGGQTWVVAGVVDPAPFDTNKDWVFEGQSWFRNFLQHINIQETDDPDYPRRTFILDVNGKTGRLFWADDTSGSTVFTQGIQIRSDGSVVVPNFLYAGLYLASPRDSIDEGGEYWYEGAGSWGPTHMYTDRLKNQWRVVAGLEGANRTLFSIDEVTNLAGGEAADWKAWTPVLTGSTTNPNLGSTGTAVGKYFRWGRFVVARFRLTFGGTGISAGSGQWHVSYPVTPHADYIGNEQIGNVRYNVTGFSTIGTLEYENDSGAQLVYYNDPSAGAGPIAVAGFTSTSGAGVAAANWIDGLMIYEAA